MKRVLKWTAIATGVLAVATGLGNSAEAQAPQRGGIFNISSLPGLASLDCYAIPSPLLVMDVAPGYSTLLRYDPDNYPGVIGDAAQSWTISPDYATYTFKLNPNIHFTDGTTLTSADVKATYERAAKPPPGVTSLRASAYASIASIETPDPLTVVFKLSRPDPALILTFASPYGCLYSAAQLAKDPKFPETHMMGTGPYKYGEFVPGSTISFTRNDDYFVKGQPYLDGVKIFFLTGAAYYTAMAGGQTDAVLGSVTPEGRKIIEASRPDTVVQEIAYNGVNQIDINNTKPPFNDVRVRRAMNLALDRPTGFELLKKSFPVYSYGLLLPSNTKLDMSREEMAKLPGWGPDTAANKAAARRLLEEAGVKDLHIVLLNRNASEPYNSLGIWVVDQLRQVGITVEQRLVDSGPYFSGLAGHNYDLAVDSNGTISSDPSEMFIKFLPGSGNNFTGANDDVLQDLYNKQAVEQDQAKRRDLVIQFEKRIVDQAEMIPGFGSVNTAALGGKIKGWKVMPSQTMNMDFRQVWIQK